LIVTERAGDGKPGHGTTLILALTKQLGARMETASNSSGMASMTDATFKAKPPAAKETMPVQARNALGGFR
jgi:hypothetical protein